MGLLADVGNAVLKVQVSPSESDDLTPAQAHGDGEDEGRIERIRPGGGEEIERLLKRPGVQLTGLGTRRLNEAGHVPADQFLTAGSRQRRAEYPMRPFGRSCGGLLLQRHQEAPYISDAQRFEPLGPDHRHEVEAYVRLVLVVRAELAARFDHVVQPVRQPVSELGGVSRYRNTASLTATPPVPLHAGHFGVRLRMVFRAVMTSSL